MLQLYDILLSNKLLMSATPLNLHCFSDRIMRKLLQCCPTHTQMNNYVQLFDQFQVSEYDIYYYHGMAHAR